MDTTILNVEQTNENQSAVLWFSREGRGAERWRRIVDSLDEVIDAVGERRGFDAQRPDGEVSLGRGGRRVIDWRALPLVIAAWQQVPAVRSALADGQLRVDGELGSPLVLALARRWTAENTSVVEPYSPELEAYFE